MTEIIGAAARSVAGPGVTIEAVSPQHGPGVDRGPLRRGAGLRRPARTKCARARPKASTPTSSPASATRGSTRRASWRAGRWSASPRRPCARPASSRTGFSVVTTLQRTVGHRRASGQQVRHARHCRRVRACEIPVLELENPESDAYAHASSPSAARAVAEDDCGAIVLGCAGMADLCPPLSAELGVPVIDGVAAAVAMAEALVRMRLGDEQAWRLCRAAAQGLFRRGCVVRAELSVTTAELPVFALRRGAARLSRKRRAAQVYLTPSGGLTRSGGSGGDSVLTRGTLVPSNGRGWL